MLVSLTREKTGRLLDMTSRLRGMNKCSIRFLSQVEGSLSATRYANKHEQLFTKNMIIVKNEALRKCRGDYDGRVTITRQVHEDLDWWLENLPHLSAPILPTNPSLVLYTDASFEGWGASIPQRQLRFGGRWLSEESQNYINYLELLAILYALEAACRHDTNCHVKIMTDNTTAVSGITKQGSTRSMPCNDISRRIWKWAIRQ